MTSQLSILSGGNHSEGSCDIIYAVNCLISYNDITIEETIFTQWLRQKFERKQR